MHLSRLRVFRSIFPHIGFITIAAALLNTSPQTNAAAIHAASLNYADVNCAINGGTGCTVNGISNFTGAIDGDTVILPAGVSDSSWTTTLNITRGITLIGATTVYGDHNTYTTIASASNGAMLSTATTIHLTDASKFNPTGGTAYVTSSTNVWPINYTSVVGNDLIGCSPRDAGTTGTLATGQQVTGHYANDQSIIRDNTSDRNSPLIKATLTAGGSAGPSQSFRLSGITFISILTTAGSSDNGMIQISSTDSVPNTSVRIDNCHFNKVARGKVLWIHGWTYGVADHDVIECGNLLSSLMWEDAYGGTSKINGNGAWEDYPWWGTGKFFFLEDCTIMGSGSQTVQTSGITDAKMGARYVWRYNLCHNAQPNSHGTEGAPQRGCRAVESYGNNFNWTKTGHNGAELRSGTTIWHDNTWTGTKPGSGGVAAVMSASIFRAVSYGAQFGSGSGIGGIPVTVNQNTAVPGGGSWDENDTSGNGISNPSYDDSSSNWPGYAYVSGKITVGTTPAGATGTITSDLNLSQSYAGYAISNTNPNTLAGKISSGTSSYGVAGYIISNTTGPNSLITYEMYTSGDRAGCYFNSGDTFTIGLPLQLMDQTGTGKGDVLTGTGGPSDPVLNTRYSPAKAAWPHNQLEPCTTWNNLNTDGTQIKFGTGGFPTATSGSSFNSTNNIVNLGSVSTSGPQGIAPAAQAYYVAAINGSNYTSEYTYPHLLVNGIVSPPTNLHVLP